MKTTDWIWILAAIVGMGLVFFGLYMRDRNNKKIDIKGEFIAFMSEQKIEVQEISGTPEQWITKSGLHRYSKINQEWQERIKELEGGK